MTTKTYFGQWQVHRVGDGEQRPAVDLCKRLGALCADHSTVMPAIRTATSRLRRARTLTRATRGQSAASCRRSTTLLSALLVTRLNPGMRRCSQTGEPATNAAQQQAQQGTALRPRNVVLAAALYGTHSVPVHKYCKYPPQTGRRTNSNTPQTRAPRLGAKLKRGATAEQAAAVVPMPELRTRG